jgi:Domain of unknown function (DUF4280)
MPQKVTETALLQCDQGASPSQLAVTSQDFCKADNKLIATEQDKQANTNIKTFGVCKLQPSSAGYLPCNPAPIIWTDTTEKDTINKHKILTEKSKCKCAIGGEISITNVGHSEKHEAE